jgi:hypothetical protein
MAKVRALLSNVLCDADVSVKADARAPSFSGRSTDWDDYVQSLMAHLHGRNLGDAFSLSVHELMTVLTRDTDRDKSACFRLGDSGKRSLVQIYDVRAARSTPQGPRDGPSAPTASMLDDSGGGFTVSPSTRSQLIVGEEELEVETVAPDAVAMKSKIRKSVLDKLNQEHEVRAIPSEDRVVTITEWVIMASTIHRILMVSASPSVKLVNSRLRVPCGIDLFQILLDKHGTAKRLRTVHNLSVLRKPYKEALADSDCSNVLDYLDMMLNARLKLEGISDEVFMIHIAEGLVGSDVHDYVKQAMNTNGMTVDDMILGIQDRADNSDMSAASKEAKKDGQLGPKTKTTLTSPTGASILRAHTKFDCQLCGEPGHGAMQCSKHPKVSEIVRQDRTRSDGDPHTRIPKHCGHCNRDGHTVDQCWLKHPELQKCTECGEHGHIKQDKNKCPAQLKAKANKADIITEMTMAYQAGPTTKVHLTEEQLDKIAARLAKASVSTLTTSTPAPPSYRDAAAPPRIQVHGRG